MPQKQNSDTHAWAASCLAAEAEGLAMEADGLEVEVEGMEAAAEGLAAAAGMGQTRGARGC